MRNDEQGLAFVFLFWYSLFLLLVSLFGSHTGHKILEDTSVLSVFIPSLVVLDIFYCIRSEKFQTNSVQNLMFDGMALIIYGSVLYLMDDYGRKLQLYISLLCLVILIVGIIVNTKFS